MKQPTIIAAIVFAVFVVLATFHNAAWAFAALLTIKLWAAFAVGYLVMAFLIGVIVLIGSQ